MSINGILNDDCLLLVFRRLPTTDQLLLRSVCSRWNTLLRYLISQQRSLALFASTDELTEFRRSILWRYTPTERIHFENEVFLIGDAKNFHLLTSDLLQSVAHLTVCMFSSKRRKRSKSVLVMHQFLNCWPSLKSLTLSRVPVTSDNQKMSTFWRHLASLVCLEQLHLYHVYDSSDHIAHSQLCTLLPKLSSFSLTGYRGDLVPLLSSLSHKLQQLRLDFVHFTKTELSLVLENNPTFGCQLRDLTLGHHFGQSAVQHNSEWQIGQFFNLIVKQCPMIKRLQISYLSAASLSPLILPLSHLSNLTELSLEVNLSQLVLLPETVQASSAALQFLRHLRLTIFGLPSCSDSLSKSISATFPNIQTLSIIYHYRFVPESLLESLQKSLPKVVQITLRRYDQEKHCS